MDLNASILIDTIFLLINENSEATRALANNLITLFRENKIVDTDESEVIRFYIRILHRIISEGTDKSSMDALRALILKMKSEDIFASHKEHLLDLEKTILDPNIMSDIDRSRLKRNIRVVIRINEIDKKAKRAFSKLSRIKDIDNPDARSEALKEYELEFGEKYDPFTDAESLYDGPKAQDSIMSNDKEALKQVFEDLFYTRSAGAIRTGQQGLNKAFGKERKLAADASMTVIAPSHNGKSVFLTNFAYWGAAYNSYPVRPDGTKPLIPIITTENGAKDNYLLLYEKIYFEENLKMPPKVRVDENNKPLKEDLEYRANVVSDFFSKHGILLVVEAYGSHEFGPVDFISRLKYYMKQGYYIPMVIFDYLMKSKLPQAAREDLSVCAGYNLVCNFTKHNGIMFLTGHQYTRDGVIRLDGKIDKVKSMGPGGVKGGYDAFQIVDIVLFLILETDHNGVVYTTMRLDKHRYVTDTPPGDKYVAYPIINGAIKDDVLDKESRAVKDIYAEGMDIAAGYKPKGQEAPVAEDPF